MDKTVFVLGAGVSAPAGFPLSAAIMNEFHRYVLLRAEKESFCDEIREQWRDLEARGIFDDQHDIEVSLTRVDIEAKESEDLRLFRGWFGDLFTDYFSHEHQRLLENESCLDYLRAFVRSNVKAGDVVVTFNYDCLIERVLRDAGLWTIYDGYGFHSDLVLAGETLAEEESACRVLKLHGSLGWISSVVDSRFLIQTEALEFVGYHHNQRAKSLKITGKRTFELPSYIKQLHTHPLPTIWRQAAEALRRASRVVFIGYSIPHADSAAWTLFLMNLQSQQKILYCWHSDSDLRRAQEVIRTFELANIQIQDRKCSVETFSLEMLG